MLLVLDNCEHVLEGVRPVVTDLLGVAPELAVLATSRAALRLQGERLLPVSPLALPETDRLPDTSNLVAIPAVDLFVQRARAVRPEFTLTDGNSRDVAEICARLDGLPLAIELAAARIRVLSPAALLGLLSDRLRVLTTGPHDAPARQRTLRAAIEWSHDLLSAEHQGYLRWLAVFAGGFTMESAAAVAADDDPFAALDGLEALLDQGLLQTVEGTDGEQRYRMLETVREFALERQVRSGEADAIRAAHARHMIALAEQAAPNLQGPTPRIWLDRLAVEQDNVRAALAWSLGDTGSGGDPEIALRLAAAIWPFWHMRGHLQEGHAWLERAIAQGSRVTPIARAATFLRLANVANNLEDHRRAELLYTEGLNLFEDLGNRRGVAGALVGLGLVMTSLGDYDRAAGYLGQGLATYREVGEELRIMPCIYAMGRLATARGEYSEAESRFSRARTLCQPEDVGSLTYIALEQAQMERCRGNVEAAGQLAAECLVRFREIGERRAEATSLIELGHLALAGCNLRRSSEYFREAAAIQLDLRDEFGLVRSLEGIAAFATAKERYDLAVLLYGTTDAWRRRTGTTRFSAEREAFGQALTAARKILGDTDFEIAWGDGRILALEQAHARSSDLLTSTR
jgi:predicted ATPase